MRAPPLSSALTHALAPSVGEAPVQIRFASASPVAGPSSIPQQPWPKPAYAPFLISPTTGTLAL